MAGKLKRLGVLGGLSRRSTIEYHQMINREVLALTKNRVAADLVTWSLDPDMIIHLLSEDGWPVIADQIENAVSNLLLEDIDGLMIASDALYCAFDRQWSDFGVPVIQGHDALAEEIRRLSLKKVGLIGSSSTMARPYYQDLIRRSGSADVVLPSQSLWVNIDYSICNRIYNGESTLLEFEAYSRIIAEFEAQDIDGIVVAAPEIALAINSSHPIPVLHTAKIHAAAAARWCVAGHDIVRPDITVSDEAGLAPEASDHVASDDMSTIAFGTPLPGGLRRKRKRKGGASSSAATSVSVRQQTSNS